MHFEAHKIDVQRQRRRRLQETDKARTPMLYDRLEALVAQREDEHVAAQKKNGRRLDEQALRAEAQAAVRRRVPELPATHALSWVHELVDWPSLADEWTRVYDVLVQRNAMRLHGRQMHEILHAHPTGYSFLDDHERFAFSKVGDAIRRMWYRRQNGTDATLDIRDPMPIAGKHLPVQPWPSAPTQRRLPRPQRRRAVRAL